MLQALRPNGDSSNYESIFHKLAYDKSIQGNEAKNLIDKYAESTSKLEKLVESIRDTTSNVKFEGKDDLKMQHKNEISYLKTAHKNELNNLKTIHNSELKKLHERIKQLEHMKSMPEVCEIDLSSAMLGSKNEVSTDDYCTEQNHSNKFKKNIYDRDSSKAKERISSLEGSLSTCQSRLRSNQKHNQMSI